MDWVFDRRIDQVAKRYDRGEIDHISWLDDLTLSHVERLRQQVCSKAMPLPACIPEILILNII